MTFISLYLFFRSLGQLCWVEYSWLQPAHFQFHLNFYLLLVVNLKISQSWMLWSLRICSEHISCPAYAHGLSSSPSICWNLSKLLFPQILTTNVFFPSYVFIMYLNYCFFALHSRSFSLISQCFSELLLIEFPGRQNKGKPWHKWCWKSVRPKQIMSWELCLLYLL